MPLPPELLNATAIALAGKAALIRGPSGAGKSDLALRCLAQSPTGLVPGPAALVADDYVALSAEDGRLMIRAPETLRGLLEVRGVGIVPVPVVAEAEVRLVVELVSGERVERLPDPIPRTSIIRLSLPVLRLAPFEPSSPLKLLIALASGYGA